MFDCGWCQSVPTRLDLLVSPVSQSKAARKAFPLSVGLQRAGFIQDTSTPVSCSISILLDVGVATLFSEFPVWHWKHVDREGEERAQVRRHSGVPGGAVMRSHPAGRDPLIVRKQGLGPLGTWPSPASSNRRNKAPLKKCKTAKIRTKQPKKVKFISKSMLSVLYAPHPYSTPNNAEECRPQAVGRADRPMTTLGRPGVAAGATRSIRCLAAYRLSHTRLARTLHVVCYSFLRREYLYGPIIPPRHRLEVSLNSKVPDPGVVSSEYCVLVNKNPLNDLETCTESNATEIRCQEQSKGGLKFDVILADPAATPPAPKRTQSPTRTKSVENIEEKLKAAEERRLSLEASKIASIAAKLAKIEEASKKKDEQTSVFITQTKEALDQKMETHVEKRDAYISAFKTKLKDHWDSVEKTRQMLEKQTLELRKEVEEKLQTASAQRDEVLKNTVDRLKEHEEQVKKVRAINKEKFASLESQIQTKLEQAEQRRVTKEKEQLEKLKSQVTFYKLSGH
ncbi:Belongs to the stathmin [Homalodisca vitripennis]|nr:Belongs to the stathmin [Homalodisca vitripennis]